MSLLPATIGLLAVVLAGWGMRELLRGSDSQTGEVPPRRSRLVGESADILGLRDRIRRAGMEEVLAPRGVLLLKGFASSAGMLFASALSGVMPGRLVPLAMIGVAAGAFLLPDLILERAAGRRHRSMVAALPDVLDLLAVSVQTGRGMGGCLLDLASSGRGPLVAEMARAGDDMAWGSGQASALEALRRRVGGPEITAFCSTLERSRRLGSPLADQLRRQSSSLRQDQRRAIEEEAARAAPKIQLVIALILVPSVLLLIVASLVANADSLINVGY